MRKQRVNSTDSDDPRSAPVPPRLPPRLEKRVASYAMAAGAAGVGLLALAPSAKADIIFTPINIFINPYDHPVVDLTVNGNVEFQFIDKFFSHNTCCPGSFWSQGSLLVSGKLPGAAVVRAPGGFFGLSNAARLPAGAVIGPSADFVWYAVMAHGLFGGHEYYEPGRGWGIHMYQSQGGPWSGARDGFLGLRFDIDGQTHFGWAEFSDVTVGRGGWVTGTLDGFAYNTIPGQPIRPNQTTPEPTTLGLLALGSLGMAAWRRKKAVTSDPPRRDK